MGFYMGFTVDSLEGLTSLLGSSEFSGSSDWPEWDWTGVVESEGESF